MDPGFAAFPPKMNNFQIDEQVVLNDSNKFPVMENEFNFDKSSTGVSFTDHPFYPADVDLSNFSNPFSLSLGGDSFVPYMNQSHKNSGSHTFSDDHDLTEATLNYINQILMEENVEDRSSFFVNPVVLQATEKVFYDILGQKDSSSPRKPLSIDQNGEPYDIFSASNNVQDDSRSVSTSSSYNHLILKNLVRYNHALPSTPLPQNFSLSSNSLPSSHISVTPSDSLAHISGNLMESCRSGFLASIADSDTHSLLLCTRLREDASKFLPRDNNQLIIDMEGSRMTEEDHTLKKIANRGERDVRKERKNQKRDIYPDEGRSKKQSAIDVEEVELSDLFDSVLLSGEIDGNPPGYTTNEYVENGASRILQPNGQPQRSKGKKEHAKKQGKKEVVDLRTLLTLCAESVSSNDHRTANELLKQIRQHSSPHGDGTQRMAHFFASALEARLAGTVTSTESYYTSLASKNVSAIDRLKTYEFHLSAFPFKRFSVMFANKMILDVAQNAEALHIVDFGIVYGFQWPILIQQLSTRPGGPPKLRITGIDYPRPGLRPAERIEVSGRHLAKYCNRFNVPFEFDAIASQKWETIQLEDLRIDGYEVLAVNCMFQFKNLLDETVDVHSPKNAVLNLIRRMNPDIFVHSIVNGSYDSPFFLTRFRETLFHFSTFFDMYDTIIPRENEKRLMFERELFGRVIMNAIACEGSERTERPETYKQWHIRKEQAGFKQLPLDQGLIDKFRIMLKASYHKDFAIDQDNHWMTHEWKGRTTHASSSWVPAEKSRR